MGNSMDSSEEDQEEGPVNRSSSFKQSIHALRRRREENLRKMMRQVSAVNCRISSMEKNRHPRTNDKKDGGLLSLSFCVS
jgi:hypothetical protein